MKACVCAVLLGFACASAQAQTSFVFLAGQDDSFALPADVATPSAGLASALAQSSFVTQNFDLTAGVNGGSANRSIAHTFASLPAGIVGATLQMRVRGGTFDLVSNDIIVLAFADGSTDLPGALEFARTFGPFAGGGPFVPDPDPGLLQSTTWGNQTRLFTLDLAALPLAAGGTLNLLPQLNAHSFLDVVVADETAADFYRLSVTAIPEPGSYALVLAGLGLLGFVARHRRSLQK